MGKPAARIGDMTAHGGAIVVGFPTVLIGGMPAARIGDMHVCPMVTPGVPPIPHVGGPVSLGSPTVLIGGMPAARMGDMLTCVGPPDTIALGCPTVLIGEAGGGGGGGGGGGAGGAAGANASAATAQIDNIESTTKDEHWAHFKFLDKAGKAISGMKYKFKDSDSKETEAILRPDGNILRDGISDGNCEAVLIDLYAASWSKEKARVDDKLKLKVKSLGIDDGKKVEINIFIKDANYSDHLLGKIETEIKSDKAEAEWQLEVDEKFINIVDEKEHIGRYSQPFFYFDAYCEGMVAKSPLLYLEDWIELEIKDDSGKVLADKKFKAILPSGEIKEGKLDSSGKAKIEKISPGKIKFNLK
jgi:uncharacterized Zn-binding protein involved in type VI secretion